MLEFKDYIMLFFVWLISVSLIKSFFKRIDSPLKLPPSPPMALPFIGHIHLLNKLLHQALFKLSNRHGPLIHIMVFSKHVIIASSPEMAKEILKTNEECCLSRPVLIATELLTYGTADIIFSPCGPYWRFMKKIFTTELLSGKTLSKFVSIREEEIESFMRSIVRRTYTNKPVEVREELIKLTNNVVSRMIMGRKCSSTNDEGGEMRKAVLEVGKILGTLNFGDFCGLLKHLDLQGLGRKVKELHWKLDTMMEEVMEEHEVARLKMGGHGDRKIDLLDLLIELMESEKSEMKLRRESVKAFALDMLLAGTNVTSIVIEWALAELIKNPHIFLEAREEIDSVVGKNRLVKESDIPNLPFIQAIVKETMRLHPPVPLIPREATRSCKIGGYDIPVNATIVINAYAIGRDPNCWDNPLEYCPERFMGKDRISKKLDVRGQHFQLLPFGSGRRGCPGISFALLVIQTTLATMIQCFDWNLNNGEKNSDIDLSEKEGIPLFLAKPLVCKPIAHFIPLSDT